MTINKIKDRACYSYHSSEGTELYNFHNYLKQLTMGMKQKRIIKLANAVVKNAKNSVISLALTVDGGGLLFDEESLGDDKFLLF